MAWQIRYSIQSDNAVFNNQQNVRRITTIREFDVYGKRCVNGSQDFWISGSALVPFSAICSSWVPVEDSAGLISFSLGLSLPTTPIPRSHPSATARLTMTAPRHVHPAALKPAKTTSGSVSLIDGEGVGELEFVWLWEEM